jgi:drug/metabolite transporter (DMT)-like permease
MTAILAIPILGEWPRGVDWAAIVIISIGVYVVSGGPLPRLPHQGSDDPRAA